MHLLLVINPNASGIANTNTDTLVLTIKGLLHEIVPGCQCAILLPESPEQLRTLLQTFLRKERPDRIVLCGGDGTVDEALPVLIEHPDIPVAILPMGTGNLLAMNMGIPTTLPEALQVAVTGHPRAIDLGRINGHFFILNASVGIDAEIMAATDRAFKQRWGRLAYYIRGIPMLGRSSQARFMVETEHQCFSVWGIGITVSNAGGRVPGGIRLAPNVRPDDGMLDGTIFQPKSWFDYVYGALALCLFRSGKTRNIIRHFEARHIRIDATPRQKVQADGDVIGYTPVAMEVLPQRLQICMPTRHVATGSSHTATQASVPHY